MTKTPGFLVLESGEVFPGLWQGLDGEERAGEIVFNTGHSGYEEVATDPSYYGQIVVMTAPQQGNYGADDAHWESSRVWIEGFVCVEMQESKREKSWRTKLNHHRVPVLTEVDTRALTLRLRRDGTPWGALVGGDGGAATVARARELIKIRRAREKDWAHVTSRADAVTLTGQDPDGPRIAAIDLGCKENSLRELRARSREVRVFPSRTTAAEIKAYAPDGIFLSNGPGDPADVEGAPETVRELLGHKPIFGICMGHQILGRALGGRTYKLKFGHRGANHPIKDELLGRIYMTSQNHGYAVEIDSLPKSVRVTHVNLNDQTVAGIYDPERRAMSVQFHPESHPGPHEATELFDLFMRQLR